MTDPLLQQGLDLMIYGMSTVFLFLTLLVTVTAISSRVLGYFLPESTEANLPETKADPTHSSSTKRAVDRKLLTLLQNAIDQHRNR